MFSGPASGLWTSPNPFSKVPAGSLRVADNVVFVAPSVIEPRRGFAEDATFGAGGSLADQLAIYAGHLLAAYDFTKIAIGTPGEGGSLREWAGTFAPVGANRLRFEGAARSVFFNPAAGIRVFDGGAPFDTAAVSSLARALDYSGGAGSIIGSTELVGDTSTAAGTIMLTGYSNTAGTVFFAAIVGGQFQAEGLTGDGGWTGTSGAADYPAVIIDNVSAAIAVGSVIAGQTSGATAVVASKFVDGATAALGLRDVVGTFAAGEELYIGNTSLLPTMAGCPQGLNLVAINASNDGWQEPDTAVAYRFTICRKDAFGRIIEGPPSGRVVLRNSIVFAPGDLSHLASNPLVVGVVQRLVDGYYTIDSPHYLTSGDVVVLTPGEAEFPAGPYAAIVDGTTPNLVFNIGFSNPAAANTVTQSFEITRSATLSLYLPDDVTSEHFVRVYRSVMTATATDIPDDELFQVYESAYLSSADIAAGALTFNDVMPESLLEVPLYTNANTGDGTLASNFRPSLALDIAYWQNRMWFLGTTDKHSAQLALIGTGSPDGLQSGDTLVIRDIAGASFTFTGITTNLTVPAGKFMVFIGGDPGINIQRTAQALCRLINDSAAPVYAFYVSSETGSPGKLLLQARVFGDAAGFAVYSSRPTAWTPQLPDPTTPLWTPLESVDNAHAARLSYSKLGQPEAVPLLNYEQIDADNHPALKMAALNYRMLVFKTDGVYFVPTGLPVSQQRLSDHVLIAPDSVARLGDSVYALTDQGVVAFSDSGQIAVSLPIQELFSNLNGATSIADLRTRAFGIAYRSAEQYILWVLERAATGAFSTDNAQAFVFSTRSNGWTRYTFGARAAVIDPATDTLLLAPAGDNRLWAERKALTDADYFDLDNAPIETALVFNDFTEESPAVMKMAQQCTFLLRENSVPTLTASFASEIHPARIEVPLATDGWGAFPWGEVPWGNPVRKLRRVQPLPPQVANACQLSVGLAASCAGTKFGFLGVDIDSDGDSKANHG